MTGASRLTPFLLPVSGGNLWVSRWYPPAGPASASVLLVPPFAEEMNRCRRMLALLADRLAGRGLNVVLPDLFGTGDSDGEFAEATIARWHEDVAATARRCAEEGAPVCAVVGLRFGALLACAAAAAIGASRFVLWQPQPSGAQVLAQFLRLRMAGSLLNAGGNGETVESLRARLRAGETLEVAGYQLTPALAEGLAGLELARCELPAGAALHWLEVAASADAPLTRVGQQQIARWQTAGHAVEGVVCAGETFWNTVEITTADELLVQTERVLAFPGAAT